SDLQGRLESRGPALDPRPENERTFGVRGHRPRVTGVQIRARCGSTEADPATLAPEATTEDASVSSDRYVIDHIMKMDWSPRSRTSNPRSRSPAPKKAVPLRVRAIRYMGNASMAYSGATVRCGTLVRSPR